MPALPRSPAESDPRSSASEGQLLESARRGSQSALAALFTRYSPWLRRWAHGRLPQWVRGALDTSDLVQDSLHRTLSHLPQFEPEHAGALRAYLRRAVDNRIRDELRRAGYRRSVVAPDDPLRLSEEAAPQFTQLVDDEAWRRYLEGLKQLNARDRRLIVGRAELGYNYRQLAFTERLPTPEAARKAVQRALARLLVAMPRP
ncbi:MAG: sigma-70 family RNA polymerase sigma factor [Acidobacteria bacterium]|nr:sigma-70 family RNA polymerase sigma factor [Acidobacteriota bacterium]